MIRRSELHPHAPTWLSKDSGKWSYVDAAGFSSFVVGICTSIYQGPAKPLFLGSELPRGFNPWMNVQAPWKLFDGSDGCHLRVFLIL